MMAASRESRGGVVTASIGNQSASDAMMAASRGGSRGGVVTASMGKPVAAPTVLAMARPAEIEPKPQPVVPPQPPQPPVQQQADIPPQPPMPPEPPIQPQILQHVAAIPLPERRPADIDADTGTDGAAQVAANIPLPPIRPGDENEAAPAPQQVVAALDAPVAARDTEVAAPPVAMPARPASMTPTSVQPAPARPASIPATLQPQPAIFADLSKGSEGFMKRGSARQPQRALGFADASPVTAAMRTTPRAERPLLTATRFEKLNFASLSAPVPSAHNKEQAQLVKPDLNATASLIAAPSRTVLIRFGVAAYQDLRAEKFSGQAVKPLRVASFSPMPDIFTGSIASSD